MSMSFSFKKLKEIGEAGQDNPHFLRVSHTAPPNENCRCVLNADLCSCVYSDRGRHIVRPGHGEGVCVHVCELLGVFPSS